METVMDNNPTCKIVVSRKKFQTLSQCPEKSVMGETDCELVVENSVVVSKCRRPAVAAAASELGFEARNSVVVFKSSSYSNDVKSQCHVCRFCSKVFSSGKALGGHVRIHGAGRSNGQLSSRGNVSRGDWSSTDSWVKKSKVPTSRSNGNCNWVRADSFDEEKAEEEEGDYKVVKNMSMDVGQEELSDYKMMSLHTLRRNPKRSRRLTDEEFCMDLTAKNTGACVQRWKEFPSSKPVFGHMKCHPGRNSRGIQPPNDDTNSTDDDSQYNTTGGDIVVHAAAAASSSGLSSDCWQSSQGLEDLGEKEEDEAVSDNESDRESMKSMKAAHQPASCSLLAWSCTAKRGRKRSIRSTQPQQKEEEEAEVDNTKELEDDTDTAHFLVMLASGAGNTNNNSKVNRSVKREPTEESVYHYKTKKSESQGSREDLEAGEENLNWEEKMKKRTDKTSSPAELGASHRKVKGCFPITNMNEEGSSELMTEYYPGVVDDMDSSPAREEEEKRGNLSQLTQELSHEQAISMKKAKGHECCMCHKVFSSGQALGGHKRCHWTADRLPQRAANSVNSNESQPKLLQGQARNVREPLFDLNQAPPVEEEDLEAAYSMV